MWKIGIIFVDVMAIVVLGAIFAFLFALNIHKEEIWERVVFKDGKRNARQTKVPNKEKKESKRNM